MGMIKAPSPSDSTSQFSLPCKNQFLLATPHLGRTWTHSTASPRQQPDCLTSQVFWCTRIITDPKAHWMLLDHCRTGVEDTDGWANLLPMIMNFWTWHERRYVDKTWNIWNKNKSKFASCDRNVFSRPCPQWFWEYCLFVYVSLESSGKTHLPFLA